MQHRGYPKWRYHAVREAQQVRTPDEESRLTPSDEGWSDTYIHKDYPKAKYHPVHTGPEKHHAVKDEAEERALGEGWYDSPAEFPAGPPAVAVAPTTAASGVDPELAPLHAENTELEAQLIKEVLRRESSDLEQRSQFANRSVTGRIPRLPVLHELERLQQFIDEACVLAAAGDASSWKHERCWVPVSDLYAAYTSWAVARGDNAPLSKGQFNEQLQRMGREQDRVRPDGGRHAQQKRVWLGIRLKTAEDE